MVRGTRCEAGGRSANVSALPPTSYLCCSRTNHPALLAFCGFPGPRQHKRTYLTHPPRCEGGALHFSPLCRGSLTLDEVRMNLLARRAWIVILTTAFTVVATTCRRKPASVEELYTTRVLGLSYLQRNQLPEAESAFTKLTKLAPDDPLGYADLGLTYLQAGRYAEAEKQLKHARELDPASTEVGLAVARLYSLTGRPTEARAMLEQLRRDTTGNARVLYALAELESQQPDSASARRYEDRLRDVLAVAPANLAVRLKLAVAARWGEVGRAHV